MEGPLGRPLYAGGEVRHRGKRWVTGGGGLSTRPSILKP
jgi:hypothetical protein